MKAFAVFAAAILGVAVLTAAPASADNTYDANELWAYEDSVPLGQRITMWECWEDAIEGRPKIDQRVGGKWKRLDVSSVVRDEELCGSRTPLKATYKLKVRDSLRWNKERKTYEAVVRTYCSGCVSYNWAIPVDKR